MVSEISVHEIANLINIPNILVNTVFERKLPEINTFPLSSYRGFFSLKLDIAPMLET